MARAVIPRLEPLDTVAPEVVAWLAELARGGFKGDIATDYATRLTAAVDNSIYQVLPAAVVFPRASDDVALAVRLLDDFPGVALTARGGGTGTNGQSLTQGVVLDLSRYMNRIVGLDSATITIEPGVVLDDLNAYLAPHGVYFAPNLSPSNRATLGGMIATDASGEGSRVHGKTAQHVLELEVVLRGGIVHRARPLEGEALAAQCAERGLVGDIHRLMRDIALARQTDIATTFPKLQRYMTGYNLAHMASADGESTDLTRLICGSEGSLGVVTQARLKLTPIEKHRALVVLHYPSFDAALASARWLLETDPGSIEAIDETVLSLARSDIIYDRVKDFIGGQAINLVEYRGDDEARIRAQVESLLAQLPSTVGHALAWKDQDIESLWTLRKKGVGLLGNAPGPRKPVPFVEDTVVPPEHLYEYVREFRAILDGAGLRYGMFGHVDVGCLHVRPALDLKDPGDEALVRRITDQVTALVTRYGGLLWGEHGKGFRSELVPHHFGVLYPELQRIKALFDPRNQLNPGKIATAAGSNLPLISIEGPTRGALDRRIGGGDLTEFSTVVHCNGNGQCFDTNSDTVMCPSSKITRDRIHSPKGRATLMREWLRLLAGQGMSAKEALQAEGTLGLQRRGGSRDFSHQVYDAMAGCLACKACATQCPVKVDVPEFRAQFLELYHRRYARPIGDYLAASLERLLPLMARAPRLVNAVMRDSLTSLAGMSDVPHLDPDTAEKRLGRHQIPISDLDALRRLSSDSAVVVVLQDAFTTFYEPAVLEACCLLLRKLGYQPHVIPYFENGKALHIKGFLKRFDRLARQNARHVEAVASLGFPMVGIEPAVVLTYRDEYAGVVGKTLPVLLLQEWLVKQPLQPNGSGSFRLLSHCTEQALVTQAPRWWAQVFDKLGVRLELVKAGCCGMCGIYGLESRHKADSLGIFDLSWRQKIAWPEDILATGFSCRHQVQRAMGFTPLHPAQALLACLDGR